VIYAYECANGHQFERSLELARYAEPQTCECGAESRKVITAVRGYVRGDVCYDSPIDGRPVTSMRARRDDLARNNCVEYDPEMKTDVARRIEREQVELERRVESTVEATIESMPAKKRERLASELQAGADCVPERGPVPLKTITRIQHGN